MTLTRFTMPPLSEALATTVSTQASATIVTLRGEADLATLPLVVDALATAVADHDGTVIVDLADTDFMDAGNVRALTRAWQALDHRGRTLILRSPSRAVTRVLVLLGLSNLIDPAVATIA